MQNHSPEQVMLWLQSKPTLKELSAEFPELEIKVRHEITAIISDSAAGLPIHLKRLSQTERSLEKKYLASRGNKKCGAELIQQALHTRMAYLAVKQHLIAEATGIEKGKVRFNLLNGFLAQKLLFSDALERKPVSLTLFRIIWPLLWQKKLLMPLVQPEGIYCFYSKQLINELVTLIGLRNCLEIAAGDGTLTRFLAGRGTKIIATDDYSWQHEVKYPAEVEKIDAQSALRKYEPEVVVCSWPPAGNVFERQVFRTRSVCLYIVISSRHRFAAGNWQEYKQQTEFDFEENIRLSSLVLPPELNAAVYLFKRKDLVSTIS